MTAKPRQNTAPRRKRPVSWSARPDCILAHLAVPPLLKCDDRQVALCRPLPQRYRLMNRLYSARRTTTGSERKARPAGSTVAANATSMIDAATPTSTTGSIGET